MYKDILVHIPTERPMRAVIDGSISLAASLNGDEFVSDPRTPLAEHDRVLILSSDAGG